MKHLQATLILVGLTLAGRAFAEPGTPKVHPQDLKRYEFTQPHMGVQVKLVFYSADETTANRAAKAAFARIQQLDALLSDYKSESELSRLSRTAGSGQSVPVGDELWHVLAHADDLSRRTEGAFDVTVGPYVKLWRRARRSHLMPTDKRLAAARRAVGYQHMKLDPSRHAVELTQPNMRLDLGGIAKGYIADEALRVLRDHGAKRALIDAGGDIALGDPPPDKQGWTIGIAPLAADGPPSRFLLLANTAIATSGDAWQHVEIDGRRYSHIVDPHTGLGLTDRSSVTVIAPTCMAADALASAVSVLGPQRGIDLVEQTPTTAALIVRQEADKAATYQTTRMARLPIPAGTAGIKTNTPNQHHAPISP